MKRGINHHGTKKTKSEGRTKKSKKFRSECRLQTQRPGRGIIVALGKNVYRTERELRRTDKSASSVCIRVRLVRQ